MNTTIEIVINRLAAVIIEEASHNQAFADKLQDAITGTEIESAASTELAQNIPKRKRRRDPAALNPGPGR